MPISLFDVWFKSPMVDTQGAPIDICLRRGGASSGHCQAVQSVSPVKYGLPLRNLPSADTLQHFATVLLRVPLKELHIITQEVKSIT